MILTVECESIWVFGYGSLIWRPNFNFQDKHVGFVNGYDRRFWQGSTYHRGTVDKPGRVVTLAPNPKGRVWGVAYHVCGKENVQKALSHLTTREQKLGCYDVEFFQFIPRDCNVEKFQVLVYFAKPGNNCYLGEANDLQISKEILMASGATGHNTEYLFRLAEFMRLSVPEEDEPHLFTIDRMVRKRMGLSQKEPTPWLTLIRCPQFARTLESFSSEHANDILLEDHIPVHVLS